MSIATPPRKHASPVDNGHQGLTDAAFFRGDFAKAKILKRIRESMARTCHTLLIVTAFIETATGIALLVIPSLISQILLGEGLTSPPALVVARVAGVALLSLGLSCWLGRNGDISACSVQIFGMLIYNLAVPIILLHGRIFLALGGIGLWPACILHMVLAIWCVRCLTNYPKGNHETFLQSKQAAAEKTK